MDPVPPPTPPLPPLPARLADPTPTVLVCTGLWLVAFLFFLIAGLTGARAYDEWFWTTLVGLLLGALGYSLFRWQRAASRRGSRAAQTGLT